MAKRDDHDQILSPLAKGYSVGKAAGVLGLDETDIRAALRAATDNFRNGDYLRQVWALEDWRLGKMLAKLFEHAMSAEGANAWHASVAYMRVSSRRTLRRQCTAVVGRDDHADGRSSPAHQHPADPARARPHI